ncbi:hypothetical protein KUCAC02_027001, partial [Chaenocephalus aceratus]
SFVKLRSKRSPLGRRPDSRTLLIRASPHSVEMDSSTLKRVCGGPLHTPKVTVWLTHRGGEEGFNGGGFHHT